MKRKTKSSTSLVQAKKNYSKDFTKKADKGKLSCVLQIISPTNARA